MINGHLSLYCDLRLNVRILQGVDVAGSRGVELVNVGLVVLVVVQNHYLTGYIWLERLLAHQRSRANQLPP